MNIRSIFSTIVLLLLASPAFAWITNGGQFCDTNSVPEPSTLALFALGAVALGITRIGRKK